MRFLIFFKCSSAGVDCPEAKVTFFQLFMLFSKSCFMRVHHSGKGSSRDPGGPFSFLANLLAIIFFTFRQNSENDENEIQISTRNIYSELSDEIRKTLRYYMKSKNGISYNNFYHAKEKFSK